LLAGEQRLRSVAAHRAKHVDEVVVLLVMHEPSGNGERGMSVSFSVRSQLSRYRERYVQTAIVVGMLIAVTLIDLACLSVPR
jgi:hypothetical protein